MPQLAPGRVLCRFWFNHLTEAVDGPARARSEIVRACPQTPKTAVEGVRSERQQQRPRGHRGRPRDGRHHHEAAIRRLLLALELLQRLQDQAHVVRPLSRGRGYRPRLYSVMSVRLPITPSAASSASLWNRVTA